MECWRGCWVRYSSGAAGAAGGAEASRAATAAGGGGFRGELFQQYRHAVLDSAAAVCGAGVGDGAGELSGFGGCGSADSRGDFMAGAGTAVCARGSLAAGAENPLEGSAADPATEIRGILQRVAAGRISAGPIDRSRDRTGRDRVHLPWVFRGVHFAADSGGVRIGGELDYRGDSADRQRRGFHRVSADVAAGVSLSGGEVEWNPGGRNGLGRRPLEHP